MDGAACGDGAASIATMASMGASTAIDFLMVRKS